MHNVEINKWVSKKIRTKYHSIDVSDCRLALNEVSCSYLKGRTSYTRRDDNVDVHLVGVS